jgi:hypothetical protein
MRKQNFEGILLDVQLVNKEMTRLQGKSELKMNKNE